MKDEDCEDRAQEQLASLKRDMRKTMEDATVRAMHKVMAEFEAKSDERLMENAQGDLERIKLVRTGVGIEKPKQEPVATLWQQGETGRTRITTPDSITDCDARWFKVSDLYTHPQDQNKDEALRLALEALKDVGYAAHKSLITLIEQALENK